MAKGFVSDTGEIVKFQKKLKRMVKRLDNLGNLAMRDGAKYMVLKAKQYAPHDTGVMRNNIFAIKQGKSWVVQSSRLGERTSFPVHLWINEDLTVNGLRYSQIMNRTGTPGYFDLAVNDTRIKHFKIVKRKLEAGLSAEFGGR